MEGKRKIVKTSIILTLVALLVAFGLIVFAQRDGSDTAKVIYVDGFVDVVVKKSGKTITLVKGMEVGVGDTITTDSESSVELKLKDGSVVKIGSDSIVIVKELGQIEITKVSRTTFELVKGKIRAVVKPLIKKGSKFNIESHNVTLGVRSTDFGMFYDPDLDVVYIITIDGCVKIDVKKFPDLNAIEVCTMEELSVYGSEKPGDVTKVDAEELEKFLDEMGLSTGDIDPPEITSAFINSQIDLEDIEDVLTLANNDLSIDKKIDISGTAVDSKYVITKVEVSTDGGTTWSIASGTDSWSFSFAPDAELEYELMMRATNAEGVVSDPDDFGSFVVKYVDLSYEDIAKAFIDSFFGYVKSSDSSGLEDIVSDIYDGRIGDLFSKEELLDDYFDELFSQGLDFTISYSISQVSFDGTSIVISTPWNSSSGGEISQGTTRWWLSQYENFTLAHTAGDWFGISIYTESTPSMTVETVASGNQVCPEAVEIMLVVPNVPSSTMSVTVNGNTNCNSSRSLTLTRSFYTNKTGKTGGFGGVFIVEDTCSCSPVSCSLSIIYDSGSDASLGISYNDFGYNFLKTIMLQSNNPC